MARYVVGGLTLIYWHLKKLAPLLYMRITSFFYCGFGGADICSMKPAWQLQKTRLWAAVLAKGTTHIRNAASEPHIQQLPVIERHGRKNWQHRLRILVYWGVEDLHGAEFTIGPDTLKVISLWVPPCDCAKIRIKDAGVEYLRMIQLFWQAWLRWFVEGDDIIVLRHQKLVIQPDLVTHSWNQRSCPGQPSQLTWWA